MTNKFAVTMLALSALLPSCTSLEGMRSKEAKVVETYNTDYILLSECVANEYSNFANNQIQYLPNRLKEQASITTYMRSYTYEQPRADMLFIAKGENKTRVETRVAFGSESSTKKHPIYKALNSCTQ